MKKEQTAGAAIPYSFLAIPRNFQRNWARQLTEAELRVALVLYDNSIGRGHQWTGPLSAAIVVDQCGMERKAVEEGLRRVVIRGLFERRRELVTEPYRYRPLAPGQLKAVPPPRQPRLPGVKKHPCGKLSDGAQTGGRPMVSKRADGDGAQTGVRKPESLLIRSRHIDPNRQKTRAHQKSDPPVENSNGRLSKFPDKTLHRYAAAARLWHIKAGHKHYIHNLTAWVTKAARTAQWDAEVQEWLDDPTMYDVAQLTRL